MSSKRKVASSSASATPSELFVACAPGCESALARELAALGFAAEETAGGVSCRGHDDDVYAINLSSRVAGRVLLRLGTFPAKSFGALETALRDVPLGDRIDARQPLAVRVNCRRSKLYHTKAVAERVLGTLSQRLGAELATKVPSNLDEDDAPPATLLVRIENDVCTVSLDSSGAHLHKRGYRKAMAKAPIRETLAAALLALCGYDGETAFTDPMCGSGTLPIEAALIATHTAPGLARTFAFERWPSFDAAAFDSLKVRALDARREAPFPIVASDRDEGAIKATRANAERAGVRIETHVRPLSKTVAITSAGLMLTNPPYGTRVGDPNALRDLYAAIGNLARGELASWRTGFVTTDDRLARMAGDFESASPYLAHGGLKIRLWLRTPS